MIARDKSTALFEEAKTLFPGGVSSPVRAFRSVEGAPLFMQRGEGALVWDEDGNQFIDYCCSWGPLILGHADKRVTQAVQEALVKGTSFGTPTRYENIMGQLIIN
ncbi:MAG TPA: aminotransferase class III-fold pyridoxal phosphate-dependent enzyme, partial [Chitinophagales bacterium]|nr:aminotransferase class III-fold pyridoxal phosphate-dependent enzyme [Chitinophagales bacterium]